MADANQINMEGFTTLGEGIGALFQAEHKKREGIRKTQSMLDTFAVMPMDPTAKPGTPGAKPMFNAKQHEFLSNMLQQKGAAAEASIQAYMRMGVQMAHEGAKTQLRLDQLQSQPTVVDTPQGQFFRGSRGWQRIPSGPTEGQKGVSDRFEKKELDRGITGLQKELEAADISDPQFMLESERHKAGYINKGEFVASEDKKQQTHIQVETDDGMVNMPKNKFNHLKRKAQEWQDFKRQKTMPRTTTARVNNNWPVLSPEEAHKAPPGTHFWTLDGRPKVVPGGAQPAAVQPDDTESDDNGSTDD